MLCLDENYKKRGKGCGRLDTTGMAHHAYTTREGPWFVPSGPNDVTIGVLGRLTKALDRAANAGAVPRGLPIWLTEFGIQSYPDDIQGVPLARQPEYQAISERIARSNERVASFSQYLLRDDPATGPDEFGGFESGLRLADGRAKPSLDGWRLPLSVRREGSKVSIWGRVRPATAPATAELQIQQGSGEWRTLQNVTTDARGSFTLRGVVPQRAALAPAVDGARRRRSARARRFARTPAGRSGGVAAQLWLLRHGEAEPHDARPDPERRLTERGEAQSRDAGRALAALGIALRARVHEPEGQGARDGAARVRVARRRTGRAPAAGRGSRHARGAGAGRRQVARRGGRCSSVTSPTCRRSCTNSRALGHSSRRAGSPG